MKITRFERTTVCVPFQPNILSTDEDWHDLLMERFCSPLRAELPDIDIDVESARRVLMTQWPFLDGEPDLDQSVRDAADNLKDLLERETFFRELADIDGCRSVIEKEHDRRYGDELEAKLAAYVEAIEQLAGSAQPRTASHSLAQPRRVRA